MGAQVIGMHEKQALSFFLPWDSPGLPLIRIITQVMGIQQKAKLLNCAFVLFPAGDELHKSLSGDPDETRRTFFFLVCLIYLYIFLVGFAKPGTAPSSGFIRPPHNKPHPYVLSAWLSSHHWTLTWGPEPHRSPMLTRNCLLLFLWILVDEGSVFSLRPPLPPLGRSRTAREHGRSSAGPMRNGAAGFQRVKRGWVWNQFFVLEEYMGSDPQYVGKVKRRIFFFFLSPS